MLRSPPPPPHLLPPPPHSLVSQVCVPPPLSPFIPIHPAVLLLFSPVTWVSVCEAEPLTDGRAPLCFLESVLQDGGVPPSSPRPASEPLLLFFLSPSSSSSSSSCSASPLQHPATDPQRIRAEAAASQLHILKPEAQGGISFLKSFLL